MRRYDAQRSPRMKRVVRRTPSKNAELYVIVICRVFFFLFLFISSHCHRRPHYRPLSLHHVRVSSSACLSATSHEGCLGCCLAGTTNRCPPCRQAGLSTPAGGGGSRRRTAGPGPSRHSTMPSTTPVHCGGGGGCVGFTTVHAELCGGGGGGHYCLICRAMMQKERKTCVCYKRKRGSKRSE